MTQDDMIKHLDNVLELMNYMKDRLDKGYNQFEAGVKDSMTFTLSLLQLLGFENELRSIIVEEQIPRIISLMEKNSLITINKNK